MIAIYKITSPSGHVYIGQSTDIEKRIKNYKYVNSRMAQTPIHRSILKYGFSTHKFEVVHELPGDIDKETLTRYEQLYMDAYKECGVVILNAAPCAASSSGRKRSEESKLLQSIKMKGRPGPMKGRVQSETTRALIREKRKLQTERAGHKTAAERAALKGNPPKRGRKGFTISDEVRAKISKTLTGKKLSSESIKKREETRRRNGNNKGWSDEARKRRSELYKGRPSSRKGAKCTPDQIEAMRKRQTGKKLSEEHKKKISESVRKTKAKLNLN